MFDAARSNSPVEGLPYQIHAPRHAGAGEVERFLVAVGVRAGNPRPQPVDADPFPPAE